MKILFAGTPEPAAACLRALLEDPRLEVCGVITQPDARRGRGRTLHPSAVAEVATAAGLPVHKFPTLKDAEEPRAVLADYAAAGVSAIAVVAYGALIPRDLLDCVGHGWINLHYSLLPRWRGAAPVQAALAAGDTETGASIFRITAGLDTGPVIDTLTLPITPSTTADELLEELTTRGAVLLAESLWALETGAASFSDQDDSKATHVPKFSTADARIDWTHPREVVRNRIRAFTPRPGAWTVIEGQRYKIGAVSPVEGTPDAGTDGEGAPASPGTILLAGAEVHIHAADGPLRIERIQPPGKTMMAAADWARGQQELLARRPVADSPTEEERAAARTYNALPISGLETR